MTREENLKAINWTIFTLVVGTAIISLGITLNDLKHPSDIVLDAQSRIGIRWGSLQKTIAIVILIISVLLVMS
ncbi:hypothetical protein [Bacillus nitroreducens]